MSDPRNFLNKASGANRWKGYYYYKAGNVLSTTYLSEDKVKAMVKGSEDNIYEVILDLDKPTKSKCNCPFAVDRQVLCKHKIAAFYALFPEFALELENMKNEFERNRVCEQYEAYFHDKMQRTDTDFYREVMRLHDILQQYGKLELYCWCVPKRCHAETIKNYIEKL
jgi:uncharacterized Zn finger protein